MRRAQKRKSTQSTKAGRAQAKSRTKSKARHFEAASVGRRTDGWVRRSTDANSAASGATLGRLRDQARDLVRNNPWAQRGLARIAASVVGWGIQPTATGRGSEKVQKLWKRWADSTECDATGQMTFYGIQALAMRTVVESGEVLIRRRRRRPEDGITIPLQLQILEPDYIDTTKDNVRSDAGWPIVQGVEFDGIGRRVAYWLFPEHPGASSLTTAISRRIPASEILHIYRTDRPGQVRGTSWFAPVGVRLRDFDEFEDATLMKQKIAACMAAFVTDLDAGQTALGEPSERNGQPIDTFEPGMILNLPPGKSVTVANPPQATDYGLFSTNQLRGAAAGLGVTYEDLTGDYSQVNFSSSRMSRIASQADIHNWRWNMIVPRLCAPVWNWVIEALAIAGVVAEADVDTLTRDTTWTPPATPMVDPSNEGLAMARNVRAGVMTHDEMVREQGYDPESYWQEYKRGIDRLKKLDITLDSDPTVMTQAGMLHPPAKPEAPTPTKATDEETPAEPSSDSTKSADA